MQGEQILSIRKGRTEHDSEGKRRIKTWNLPLHVTKDSEKKIKPMHVDSKEF
jgi:hypothetical protein